MYNNLDTFRITGGEPLLSKDIWKVFDYIIETKTPNTNLKLSINSNLGVPNALIDKLIEKCKTIITEKKVKELIIFTSCDGYGKQSEYARYGMEFNILFKNIDKILTQLPQVTVVIMSTFNIFSPFSYEQLVKKVYEFKIKHFTKERYWNSALILDTSYLNFPDFLSYKLLRGYLDIEYLKRCVKFMKFNSTYRSLNSYESQSIEDVGFSTKEIEKIVRIIDIFLKEEEPDPHEMIRKKIDFKKFIREYEKRRGYVCEDYFPELVDFINSIKDVN